MTWSLPLGRFLGSELRVHATFFLLLAWIGLAAFAEHGLETALFNVVFVMALFACVVAHEYGHALMARRYGIRTPDITLLPIGGLARLERMPENPRHEIAVALAGPAVNVVIWAVLTALGARGGTEGLSDPIAADNLLGRLAMINLALAVFNMVPAFPMDGGRVLRALLSMVTDRVNATRIAAAAGQVAAFLFGFWGLSTGNLVLVLIAIFIFLAAQGEAADVAQRDFAKGLHLRDAMITSFERLAPSDTLHVAGQLLIRTTQHEFPVLDDSGHLCGFLTRQALFQAMAEGDVGRPVAEAMTREVPQLALTAPLSEVLEALHLAPAVAGVDRQGHVLGYVTSENLGELMVLRARR